MAMIYGLFGIVTLVLFLAIIVADGMLQRQTAWRDFVWRVALVSTAALPLAFLVRQMPSGLRLELAVLPVRTAAESTEFANTRSAPIESVGLHAALDDSAEQPAPQTSRGNDNDGAPANVGDLNISTASNLGQDVARAESQPEPRMTHIARSALVKAEGDAETPTDRDVVATRAIAGLSMSAWFRVFFAPVLVALWVVGALAYVVWLVFGLLGIRRTLCSATVVTGADVDRQVAEACKGAGLRNSVPIVTTGRVSMPIVAGLWEPRIAVPNGWWADTPTINRQEILLHEARHIARHDIWFGLLQHLVAAIFWPHPLVHWMGRRIAHLREVMCDGHVALNGDPIHYAETLLTSAQRTGSTHAILASIGFGPTETGLESRISRVLHDCPSTLVPPKRSFRALLAVCCLVSALTVATVHITAAADEETKANTQENTQATTATPEKGTQVVKGTVKDSSNDAPVAGAQIYLVKRPQGGSFTLPLKPQQATTNEQGEFQLVNVHPARYLLWAEKQELTSLAKKLTGLPVTVEKDAAPDPVELSLHDGCQYNVTVRSRETQKPIPGAKVRFSWTDLEREFVAGDDGVVRVFGLSSDDWFFRISAPEHAVHFERTKPTKLGSTTDFAVELDPGGQIIGILRDEAEQPIAGARLTVSNPDYNMSHYARATTDERGRFRLQNLPRATKLEISARIDGFKRVSEESLLGPDQRTTSLKIVAQRLAYGGDVVVTIVNGDDEPLANAKLTNQGNSSADTRTGLTDEKGQVRLNDLFDSFRGKSVVVRAEGYVTKSQMVAVGTKEEPAQAKIRLVRGESIKGRVVLPSGEPGRKLNVYYNEGEHGNQLGGRVSTDENGRFSITGLPKGCTFTVYVPKGCAPFDDRVLTLGGDEEVLVQLEPHGVVRAQAFDAGTGKRIENYRVRITFSQSRKQGEPTRNLPTKWIREGFDIKPSDKEFLLGSLPPGMPMQLTVTAEGYEPTVVPRVVADVLDKSKVELVKLTRIDPSTYKTVSGVVRPQEGGAVAGAYVRLVVGRSIPGEQGVANKWTSLYNWVMLESGDIERHAECVQFLKTTTDKEGRFTFKNVRPGKWMEVYCTGPGFAPGRKGDLQKLSAEDLKDVNLDVEPTATLLVTLDRSEFPTAHSVSLRSTSLFSLDGVFGSTSLVFDGESNKVLFKDIPAGTYHLTLKTAYQRLPGGRLRNDELGRIILTIAAKEEAKYAFE